MILGLFFAWPPRFFRPLEQNFHAAVGIRVAILLEIELGDMPEVQPGTQLVTQIMPSVFQCGEGRLLPRLIAPQVYLDVRIAPIRANTDLGHGDIQHPVVRPLGPDPEGCSLAQPLHVRVGESGAQQRDRLALDRPQHLFRKFMARGDCDRRDGGPLP